MVWGGASLSATPHHPSSAKYQVILAFIVVTAILSMGFKAESARPSGAHSRL